MLGMTEAAAIIHQDVPCRINWLKGEKKIFFGKDSYFRDGRVYCGVLDVDINDLVEFNGKTYEIVDVENPDEMNWHLVLDIRLVQ